MSAPDPEAVEPIRGSAAALLRRMEASRSVPTATTIRTFSVAGLDELTARLPDAPSASRILAYAVTQAARWVPAVTRRFARVDGVPAAVSDRTVHLGIAVDMRRRDGTRGLLVPVLRDAAWLNFPAFVRAYDALITRAREGGLDPGLLAGANLILTNTSAFGSTTGVPLLPEGPGAIVALGAIGYPAGFERVGERLGADRVCTASCTYDHRVVQGADSGSFLDTLAQSMAPGSRFIRHLETELHRSPPRAPVIPVPDPATHRDLSAGTHTDVPADARDVLRREGHRHANLDPLTEPVPALAVREALGLPEHAAFEELLESYCGTLAIDVEHLASDEERRWWYARAERADEGTDADPPDPLDTLRTLAAVDELENYLQQTYPAEKTLSVQGLDTTVLMARRAVHRAAARGVTQVTIGMAHRGRLATLVHAAGMPYERLLREFEAATVDGATRPDGPAGDVKQHLGWSGTMKTASGQVSVTLLPNPSHLEAVTPVAIGVSRAILDGPADGGVLPLLLHGDASFTGQGIVAETLNLHQLESFSVGGALHILQDNQVGFTTGPRRLRSTRWPSDVAKGYDIPVVHVNADDPDACLRAVDLALDFRQRYRKDVVVHVVGYRRLGHTETDDPTSTHPDLYARIRAHPRVVDRYESRLVESAVTTPGTADTVRATVRDELQRIVAGIRRSLPGPQPAHVGPTVSQQETGHPESLTSLAEDDFVVSAPARRPSTDELRSLGEELAELPAGFPVHPKVARFLQGRRQALAAGRMDWAHSELLAFAVLGRAGTPMRLSGQDFSRGAFSQRHLLLWPTTGDPPLSPLKRVTGGEIGVHDSPLSEAAVLAYEYGYAAGRPDALVVWEAQFGDFANGAQVLIDQFVASGYAKWGTRSRLTMLLPHGYEGGGPEHSSARIERYLQLAAEHNLRLAVPTTPAQYFHLLLDQATAPYPAPLVVATPKSLLRRPEAQSAVASLADGRFQPLLITETADSPDRIRHAILCAGKIYYDLAAALGRAAAASEVAVIRLELLYPFPDVAAALARYPNLCSVTWMQEEPENMGAFRYVAHHLRDTRAGAPSMRYVGRPAAAAVAEGYPVRHRQVQERLLADMVDLLTSGSPHEAAPLR